MSHQHYGQINQSSNKPIFIGIGLLSICVAAYAASYFVIKGKIDQKIAEVRRGFDDQVKIDYKSVKFNPFKNEIALQKVSIAILETKDPRLNNISLEMKRIAWSKCDFWNENPNHCTFTINGLTAKSKDPTLKMLLDQYEKSVATPFSQDVLIKYDYNPDADFALNFNAQFALKGMFKVDYRIKSSGMDLMTYKQETKKLMEDGGKISNDFTQGLAMLDNVKNLFDNLKLELVSLDLHDKGGVNKLLGFMSKTTGQSVAQIKASMHKEVKKALIQKEFASLKAAVDKFVEQPKSIGIVYKPAKVEKLSELFDAPNPFAGLTTIMETTKVKINKDSFRLNLIAPLLAGPLYTH